MEKATLQTASVRKWLKLLRFVKEGTTEAYFRNQRMLSAWQHHLAPSVLAQRGRFVAFLTPQNEHELSGVMMKARQGMQVTCLTVLHENKSWVGKVEDVPNLTAAELSNIPLGPYEKGVVAYTVEARRVNLQEAWSVIMPYRLDGEKVEWLEEYTGFCSLPTEERGPLIDSVAETAESIREVLKVEPFGLKPLPKRERREVEKLPLREQLACMEEATRRALMLDGVSVTILEEEWWNK